MSRGAHCLFGRNGPFRAILRARSSGRQPGTCQSGGKLQRRIQLMKGGPAAHLPAPVARNASGNSVIMPSPFGAATGTVQHASLRPEIA